MRTVTRRETLGGLVRIDPRMRKVFGAPANDAHRGANLMREAGREAADGREAIGMQQPPFQLDLTAMFLQQVRAGLGEFVSKLAEFSDQQLDFVLYRFRRIARRRRFIGRKAHYAARQFRQRARDVAPHCDRD